ncbi:helix-turn-helix domain-containing protein [Amphibacillus sp. Q70]|uniref:helix-turn-helix domain-containing protein n=1 Tax=Amphibacillus sp. Q70 TaxID=3453416 RepID=UPI003F8417DC
MTAFDIVKKLCGEQKIAIVELEEKLGFSRNSLYSWKKNKPSSDKLEKVADFFNVSTDYLLGRTDKKQYDDSLTEKDERDIAKRMAKMRQDLMEGNDGDGLAFSGEPMSEEAVESLLEALEFVEKQTTKINKKYTPKRKRK